MKALLDADILLYEIGSIGQFKDEEGELIIRSWSFVEKKLDAKVKEICDAIEATEEPLLFITGSQWLTNAFKRTRDLPVYKPNFRIDIAKTKVYKGTRKDKEKPHHYEAILLYLVTNYETNISNGCEADDMLATYQMRAIAKGEVTCICSRDKDLNMVDGYHYSWECGLQREKPLFKVRGYGELTQEGKKVTGNGLKFFHYQLLIGDSVDNIPGLKGVGPAKAMELLGGVDDEDDGLEVVQEFYKEKIGDDWHVMFGEQAELLWMRREVDESYAQWMRRGRRLGG